MPGARYPVEDLVDRGTIGPGLLLSLHKSTGFSYISTGWMLVIMLVNWTDVPINDTMSLSATHKILSARSLCLSSNGPPIFSGPSIVQASPSVFY
jgi:hypothetical protein